MAHLYRKLLTFGRDVRVRGGAVALKSALARGAVVILARRYSFPAAWHNPTVDRPYRHWVASVVSDLKPKLVCEVGCGLGSILARVNSVRRVGYDIDPGVLRAARLRRRFSQIEFRLGGLEAVDLLAIDCLILINWPHQLAPHELDRQLGPLLPRCRYLMVDGIDQNVEGYAYHHDFEFLRPRATLVQSFRVPGEDRTFSLFRVTW